MYWVIHREYFFSITLLEAIELFKDFKTRVWRYICDTDPASVMNGKRMNRERKMMIKEEDEHEQKKEEGKDLFTKDYKGY